MCASAKLYVSVAYLLQNVATARTIPREAVGEDCFSSWREVGVETAQSCARFEKACGGFVSQCETLQRSTSENTS